MDTIDSGDTTIGHLFSAEPAAAPAPAAPATEQPLPPDVTDSYQFPPQIANAPDPAATPAPEQAAPQQPHMVPVGELIETRRRAQFAEETARQAQARAAQLDEAMRRLTQPQQPQVQQPAIDPELDPAGAFNALRSEMQNSILNTKLDISERYAREKFGDAAVDAATKAAIEAGYNTVFVQRPDAYKELMEWHQGQQVRAQIGGDPAAYREQLKAEIRAQLLAEMRQGTPPPSNLPPSLSTATRVNGAPEVVASDRDFFKSMMNPKVR